MRHDDIWRAIDALAAEHGPVRLRPGAQGAGSTPPPSTPPSGSARDGRARWPSTESVAKVLAATGTGIEAFAALVTGMPAALPRGGGARAPTRRGASR